jgi:hypothetical protein
MRACHEISKEIVMIDQECGSKVFVSRLRARDSKNAIVYARHVFTPAYLTPAYLNGV